MTHRIWNVRLGLIAGFTVLVCSLSALTNSIIDIAPGESIQAAIQQAPEGAVLRLLPGTHTENLRIERGITLIGDVDAPDAVILEPRLPGPAITVSPSDSAAEVMLEGFSIRGAFGYLPDGVLYISLATLRCSHLLIESCQGSGIAISGSGEVSIRHCTMRQNDQYGIDVRTDDATVTGTGNQLGENGAALGGWAPPSLRIPLVSQTESLIVQVPRDYATLQEALDAVPPSGVVLLAADEIEAGATIWKDVTIVGTATEILSNTMISTSLVPGVRGTITLSLLPSAQHVSLQSLDIEFLESFPMKVGGALHLEEVACSAQGTVHQDALIRILGGGLVSAVDSSFKQFGGIAIQGFPGSSLLLENCWFEGNRQDLQLNGMASAVAIWTPFIGSRTVSIAAEQSHLILSGCDFEEVTDGIRITDGRLTAQGCWFSDASGTSIQLEGDSVSQLLSVGVSGNGKYHLVIDEAAQCAALACKFRGAACAGVLATGDARFHLEGCTIQSCHGTGLLVSERSDGTIGTSSIEQNGSSPDSELFQDGPGTGGGILASMDSRLTINECTIRENGLAGVLVDPRDPFYEIALGFSVDRYGHPEECLPQVVMTSCKIEENEGSGVSVRAYGNVGLINCTLSGNTELGVLLDSSSWHIEGNVKDLDSFSQTLIETDGVRVSLDGCTIDAHSVGGMLLSGRSLAALRSCQVHENAVGIFMEATAFLRLEGCTIGNNSTFGVFFSPVDSDGFTFALPYPEQVVGFGNIIPGPGVEDGNRAAAFSAGDYSYLLAEPPPDEP